MAQIPEDINAEISPVEFELLIREYLVGVGEVLTTFKAQHNTKLKETDGEYQIDIYCEFEFVGATFKILVECKKHKNRIKREVVQILNDKLRSTGSQKGMIFSTSGFQEGAITYAKEHGIALIRVIDVRYTYFTKSQDSQNFQPPSWVDLPKFVAEFRKDNSTSFLQKGNLDPLRIFLFEN